MTTDVTASVREIFGSKYERYEGFIDQCIYLCTTYDIDASDLENEFESYCLKTSEPTPNLSSIETELKSRKKIKKEPVTLNRRNINSMTPDVLSKYGNGTMITPSKKRVCNMLSSPLDSPSSMDRRYTPPSSIRRLTAASSVPVFTPPSPCPGSPFATRAASGAIDLSYNADIGAIEAIGSLPSVSISWKQLHPDPSKKEKPFRYMHERREYLCDIFEDQFRTIEAALIEKFKLKDLIAPVGVSFQSEIVCIGRICCDSTEGRLNVANVILEGGRDNDNGERIKIDLSDIKDYSLFPGQIVAIRGLNPNGNVITASQIYSDASLPMSPCLDGNDGCSDSLHAYVACGPFMVGSDNNCFAPLHAMLRGALELKEKSQPDAVILLGPFVYSKSIADGDCDKSFDDYMDDVWNLLCALSKEMPRTNFFVLPSYVDLSGDFVYPQPLPLRSLHLASRLKDARIHELPNPCMISINGVTLALSTCDVLMNMMQDNVTLAGACCTMKTPIRLVNHLVQQRSMYPLFPAKIGTPVDFLHLDKLLLPSVPDILIFPSDLIRTVDALPTGPLYINPGKVVRGESGGTFAKIYVRPPVSRLPSMTAAMTDSDALAPTVAKVADRTRVDIVKV